MSSRQVAPAQPLPVFCLVAPRACEIGARSPGRGVQKEKRPFPCKPTGFILTSEANNPDSLKCEILLGPPMVRKRRQAISQR